MGLRVRLGWASACDSDGPPRATRMGLAPALLSPWFQPELANHDPFTSGPSRVRCQRLPPCWNAALPHSESPAVQVGSPLPPRGSRPARPELRPARPGTTITPSDSEWRSRSHSWRRLQRDSEPAGAASRRREPRAGRRLPTRSQASSSRPGLSRPGPAQSAQPSQHGSSQLVTPCPRPRPPLSSPRFVPTVPLPLFGF
jgi:hypothetical protein